MKKLLLSLIFTLPLYVYADCLDMATTYDQKSCLSKELKKADAKLAKTYRAALSGIQNKNDLIKAERLWAAFKEQDCKVASGQYSGGSMEGVVHLQCMLNKTHIRERELRGLSDE